MLSLCFVGEGIAGRRRLPMWTGMLGGTIRQKLGNGIGETKAIRKTIRRNLEKTVLLDIPDTVLSAHAGVIRLVRAAGKATVS